MKMTWEEGFRIKVDIMENAVVIAGNKEGLISLAHILADLSEEEPGNHIHLDEYNSLEDGSVELIIDKM